MTDGRRQSQKPPGSLAELLGEIPGYGIAEAFGENSVAYLKFEGPGVPPLTVMLGNWGTGPVYLRTGHLGIRFMSPENSVLDPAQDRILRWIYSRLYNVPLDTILHLIPEQQMSAMPDIPYVPGSEGPGDAQQASGTSDSTERGQSGRTDDVVTVSSWGAPDRWRRFIFRREFERNQDSIPTYDSLQIVTVSHGESECNHSTPPISSTTPWIYNYPWVRPFAPLPKKSMKQRNTKVPGHINTDLRDIDIITGGIRKLDAVLDDLQERVDPDNAVLVMATCVPHVIGDDMTASIRRWKGSCPIWFNDMLTPGSDYLSELLRHEIETGRRPKSPPRSTINVLGLPPDETGRELLDLLGEAGIKINVSMVPFIDIKASRNYLKAGIQIITPNPYIQSMYDKVFMSLPIKTVVSVPPYGIRGTREWLVRSATAAGMEKSMKKVWRRHYGLFLRRFGKVRKIAAKTSLGFVISPEEYGIISDPTHMAGIPVLDMLDEFGFGTDLFVYKDKAASDPPLLPRIKDHTRTRIHWFTDRRSLADLLKNSGCMTIYSDLHVDDRLVEAGKTPFSLQFFERGLGGAMRTVERLLGASAPNIYNRYSQHAPKKSRTSGIKND
jgi:hypothetical protein